MTTTQRIFQRGYQTERFPCPHGSRFFGLSRRRQPRFRSLRMVFRVHQTEGFNLNSKKNFVIDVLCHRTIKCLDGMLNNKREKVCTKFFPARLETSDGRHVLNQNVIGLCLWFLVWGCDGVQTDKESHGTNLAVSFLSPACSRSDIVWWHRMVTDRDPFGGVPHPYIFLKHLLSRVKWDTSLSQPCFPGGRVSANGCHTSPVPSGARHGGDVRLPGKVDVVVHEILGNIASEEGVVPCLRNRTVATLLPPPHLQGDPLCFGANEWLLSTDLVF